MVLTYREEYPQVMGSRPRDLGFKVSLIQEWLDGQVDALRPHALSSSEELFVLYGHCTEKTSVAGGGGMWRRIFSSLGMDLEERVTGCCGMCGVYGHEARHQSESKALFDMSWRPRLRNENPGSQVMATGFSCRSQIHRIDGTVVEHPASTILRALEGAS